MTSQRFRNEAPEGGWAHTGAAPQFITLRVIPFRGRLRMRVASSRASHALAERIVVGVTQPWETPLEKPASILDFTKGNWDGRRVHPPSLHVLRTMLRCGKSVIEWGAV